MTSERTSPELERLRAAHEQIPDPNPAVMTAVRERLQVAADREPAGRRVRTRSRRPLRRVALVGAVALVLAAVTAASIDVSTRGGPRLDAIAQARAALVAPTGIVHYTVALSAGGVAECKVGPLEVWRASHPTRWRAVQPVSSDPSCGTMDLSQGYGPVVAPRLEVSYGNGRTSSYVPGRDLMLVIVDNDAPKEGELRAPSSAAAASSIQLMANVGRDGRPPAMAGAPDPVSDVEQLLAKGQLRDEGERMRDGRRVRVLAGGWTRGEGGTVFVRTTIEYVVDAESFAPIAATTTTRSDLDGDPRTAKVRATFGDYERIPLTSASAELLKIKPERRPKVVELTIEQIKNPGA
jgi:hypothetical protein